MDSSLFPILAHGTYLNTPTSGVLSRPILAWRRQHDELFAAEGSRFRLAHEPILQSAQKSVSDFFNAAADRTVLLPNFSIGFNTLLASLPRNFRFLLLQEDYPSVNYSVERQGFDRHYIPIDEHLESRIIDALKTYNADVFAFSIVQYITGIKIDLGFVRELKQRYPKLLIVADGTQYCGTEPFDFAGSGIDALIASGYKWMLAGYGNGFMLASEYAIDCLKPTASTAAKPNLQHLKGKNDLSFSFEPGHLDTLTMGTLQQAVQQLSSLDLRTETAHRQRLVSSAFEAFSERRLLDPCVMNRTVPHGSFFNLLGTEQLFQKLTDSGIVCVMRGSGIRVGFHFYNSQADLGNLVEVLDAKT